MPRNKSETGRYEFSEDIKREALKRAGFACENCQKTRDQVGQLYYHHKLGVKKAFDFHPEIPPRAVASIYNIRVLCFDCHKLFDDYDLPRHGLWAEALLQLLREGKI